jgi:hypothetical protein
MILIGYYVACLLTLPAWLSVRMHRSDRPSPPLTEAQTLRLARWVFAIFGLTAVATAVPYFLWPYSIWGESEGGVLQVAALASRGLPLYSAPGGLAGYALLYGPLTFTPYALAFAAGGGVLLAKLMPCGVFVAALAILWRQLRTLHDPRARAIATLAIAAFLLPHSHPLMIPKGDAWTLLYASLPLLTRGKALHGVSLGVCAALAFGTKIPAAVAFLPYLIELIAQRRYRQLALTLASGLIAQVAVHATLGAGLADYLALIRLASHHALTLQLALASLMTLALPFAVYLALLRSQRLQAVDLALIVATVLMVIPASKVGAGSYHLAPLMAPLCLRLTELWPRHSRGPLLGRSDASFGLLLTVLVCLTQLNLVSGFVDRARTAGHDLDAARPVFASMHEPFSIAPSHDGFQRLEPYLVLPSIVAGAESPVTTGALSDWQLAGQSLPPHITADLLDCRRTWLSDAGVSEPWGAMSTYATLQNESLRGEAINPGSLFDAKFRRRFHALYTEKTRMGPFDAWRCRAG